jgi:hypothetical protein
VVARAVAKSDSTHAPLRDFPPNSLSKHANLFETQRYIRFELRFVRNLHFRTRGATLSPPQPPDVKSLNTWHSDLANRVLAPTTPEFRPFQACRRENRCARTTVLRAADHLNPGGTAWNPHQPPQTLSSERSPRPRSLLHPIPALAPSAGLAGGCVAETVV